MSASDAATPAPLVMLRITGGDPLTEVFVRDGVYTICARGYTPLDVEVSRGGYYDVCFSAGGEISDHRLLIDNETPDEVLFKLDGYIPFSASLPLACGTETDRDHARAVAEWVPWAYPDHPPAKSAVLICLRSRRDRLTAAALEGVGIHSADQPLVALRAVRQTRDASCAAFYHEAAPGNYCVRVGHHRRAVEFPVPVVRGWVTLVFLPTLEGPSTEGERERGADAPDGGAGVDLASVAFHAVPLDGRWGGWDEGTARVTELARWALVRGGRVPPFAIAAALKGVTDRGESSPFLALYASLLLLRDGYASAAKECLERLPLGWREVPDARAIAAIWGLRGAPPVTAVTAVAAPPDARTELARVARNGATGARSRSLREFHVPRCDEPVVDGAVVLLGSGPAPPFDRARL